MLKRIRIILGMLCFTGITLLFLDFTGVIQRYLGFLAKVQLLPAVLALNVGVALAVLLLTLLFGRFYCSIICPLGVMQDGIYVLRDKVQKRWFTKANPNGTKPLAWLRWTILGLFVVLMVIPGLSRVAILIAPYSAYGRIASSLFQPLYLWVNNLLAALAEHYGSYAFYSVDVWLKAAGTLVVAVVTFLLIAVLAWRGGRTWCNTVCPVGTVLGFVSKWALFKPVIDTTKCNGCTMCARKCKAACINASEHQIDYSRCVGCMDCIENCKQGAISYKRAHVETRPASSQQPDGSVSGETGQAPSLQEGRRSFLVGAAAVAAATAVQAQEKEIDGGLAVIEDKKIPARDLPIKPAGSLSIKHFSQHCTACQLCVSACPNGVLRPSSDLKYFMQPEMSFERGYCRPECVRCAEVCPAGAIQKITPAEKTEYQVGLALFQPQNCVVMRDGVKCGHCADHCPTGAIVLVPKNQGDNPDLPMTLKVPSVDESKCIGCGACENLCPSRPYSAIYVVGKENHLA